MTIQKKGRPEPVLTPAIIADLLRKGMSQSDIAREWGYTRQYVSWIKYYHGGIPKTPRETASDHFPFVMVGAEHGQTAPYKRLRDHGEYMATGGLGMSQDKLSRLRGFYRKLHDDNVVLEYDPGLPPEPGLSSQGGWAYRSRVGADEDLLIRVNEYTDLTEPGRMIWRFPPVEP